MKKKDRRLRSSSDMKHRKKDTKILNLLTQGQPNSSVSIQTSKAPYKLGDGEWLKLRYDGSTKCFIVYLNHRMSYAEIKDRMHKAFGDLDGGEVRT